MQPKLFRIFFPYFLSCPVSCKSNSKPKLFQTKIGVSFEVHLNNEQLAKLLSYPGGSKESCQTQRHAYLTFRLFSTKLLSQNFDRMHLGNSARLTKCNKNKYRQTFGAFCDFFLLMVSNITQQIKKPSVAHRPKYKYCLHLFLLCILLWGLRQNLFGCSENK